MSERFPTLAGEVLANMDLQTAKRDEVARFPFLWSAAGSRFEYPEAAKHLFCKCGSAAEAFFLLPFTQLDGVEFTDTSAISDGLELAPQLIVGKHRVDFALRDGPRRFAIEIDGLAFHQRTAAQVEGDYVRARRVTALGYSVVRFTAGEAFRDAIECWFQVNSILARREIGTRKAG